MTKFGFVTCVQLGLSCLEKIDECGVSLDTIVTLHDDLAGQKSGRVFLDSFCERTGTELVKIAHINEQRAVEAIGELDWLFIIGWSQIANTEVINAPREGVLGMHPTLLPEGRGRAAIPWAILKGLDRTGVTLFKLDEGVDTGPILDQVVLPLSPETTATDLYQRVNEAHCELIGKALPGLVDGTIQFEEQDEALATVWPGRKPEDGEINLKGSVVDAERLIRAVTHPYPGAFFVDGDGRKTIVWCATICDSDKYPNVLTFADGFLRLIDFELA